MIKKYFILNKLFTLENAKDLLFKRNRQKEYSKKNRRRHKEYVKSLEKRVEELEEEVQNLSKRPKICDK